MEPIYLGISFIDYLKKLLFIVFSEVFTPILTDILEVFINYFMDVIWSMWSEWLVMLLAAICSLVDFLENIFNVFAGISTVEVKNQHTYLLDAFFQMREVTIAFATITLMAVAICFIFTIYKTAKSIADMALEDKNPVSKVLTDGMKAGFTFMLIPFLCIAMLQISTLVTNQAINAFDAAQEGHSTIGTIIFLSSSMDADRATCGRRSPTTGQMEEVKVEGDPSSDDGQETGEIEGTKTKRDPKLDDDVRKPYMTGEKDYTDMKTVKGDFFPSNFNFIEGFISAVLILFILAGASMIFIRRLFELLLLYIISPFFVSTIPLDDGATFARWRELFVAKFFSGFGVIFSMRYYLLLVPSIAGDNLCLYDKNLPNALTINTVLKLFLIIGGAWAVYKSQSLILQILNKDAAQAEQQAGSLISGMIIGSATTAANLGMAAATGGSSAAVSGLGGLSGGGGGMGSLGNIASAAGDIASSASSGGDEKQKYTGK